MGSEDSSYKKENGFIKNNQILQRNVEEDMNRVGLCFQKLQFIANRYGLRIRIG